MAGAESFDRTVAALYRAAAGQERFDHALTLLVESLGEKLVGAQMVGVNPGTGGLTFSHTNLGAPGEAELEYMREYHVVDPRIPLLMARAPGDWFYCEDAFTEEQVQASPYYRELLIPYGGRYTATVKLHQDEREIVLIAILARLGAGGFDAAQREYLTRIGIHLREALEVHRHVRALAIGHAVGIDLIERLGKPAWVIDERLEIAGMNSMARARLAADAPLREHSGRLGPASQERHNAFAATVRELVKRSDGGERSPRGYLRLGGPGVVASVALFEPQQTMQAFGDRRHLLVMLHETEAAPEPDVYLWQVAFDLTPAEAKACREVYDGLTLREAAQNLGISANTVNSQLDSAYAKVGAANKVELVQRLRSLG